MLVRSSINTCSAAGSRRSDRKSTRLNSSHLGISYAVFCLKKKKKKNEIIKLVRKKKKNKKKKNTDDKEIDRQRTERQKKRIKNILYTKSYRNTTNEDNGL